jgi:L,D-transpeptidase catalytic domain
MPLSVEPRHDTISVPRRMKAPKIIPMLAAIGFAIIFGGCADFTQELTAGAQRLPDFFPGAATSEGYWRGDNSPGPAKIVVHVGEQRAYFYKGHRLVGESTVSTGKRGFDTPPGRYHVTEKDKNHISSEFGDYINNRGEVVKSNIDVRKDAQPKGTHFDGARMPYFMRFNGGYGMHAGYVPQFRASHGCIRLPPRMARHFFENTPDDTPVIVRE